MSSLLQSLQLSAGRFFVGTAPHGAAYCDYASRIDSCDLNSVNMISATDGWAVRQCTRGMGRSGHTALGIFRWDGANWIRVAVNTPGVNALTLQEVTCVHANDCWAVRKRRRAAALGWRGLDQ